MNEWSGWLRGRVFASRPRGHGFDPPGDLLVTFHMDTQYWFGPGNGLERDSISSAFVAIELK